jgi:adenosylhomocysteine nucleosidase
MLTIAAALSEELQIALGLCRETKKSRTAGIPVWTGRHHSLGLTMVKLGTGPARAAANLGKAIAILQPGAILVIGYAGAVDPALHVGDLVMIDHARPVCDTTWGAPLEQVDFAEGLPLSGAEEMLGIAREAGLPALCGTTLTSKCLIGHPLHKGILHERFGAPVVDMETAALAAAAANSGIPLSCVRVISDAAGDDFFSFMSYDPGKTHVQIAAKALSSGHLMSRYQEWRKHSQTARSNLSLFLKAYLKTLR